MSDTPPSKSLPLPPPVSPNPGSVADELKHMVEKHVDSYLDARAVQTKIAPLPISSARKSFLDWFTLLGGFCGSVNNIWNVLLLLQKLGAARMLRRVLQGFVGKVG
jgi:hypothetical protein